VVRAWVCSLGLCRAAWTATSGRGCAQLNAVALISYSKCFADQSVGNGARCRYRPVPQDIQSRLAVYGTNSQLCFLHISTTY
jgi:hypothetical protein